MEKRQFRVYKNPPKYIYNAFQLRTIIKKNPKTLKGLYCEENHSNIENTNFCALADLLKKNKSISSVHINSQKYKFHGFQRIYLALKNLQSLSKLSLYFPQNEFLIQKIYHSFLLSTKGLKRLTSLSSSLLDSEKVATPRRALYYLTPFRLLSEISLSLYSVNWLTDLTWRSFSYHLPSFLLLTSLEITVNFRNGFTQKHAIYLFSAIKNLPLLTTLNLSPIDCKASDFPVFRVLFENLKNLLYFQDLTLCLRSCENPEPEDQDLLVTGLAMLNPSSFRKLLLEFYRDFSDSDFSKLLAVIQRFSALAHLSLWFSDGDQVTAKGFSDFPVAISQFPALKILDLSVNSAMDTRSFFEIIAPCLQKLKELVSFTIYTMSNETVDNLGVERLCSQLGHLSKLEILELGFGYYAKLDENCIESIAQALRNLTGLKSLYLDWKNDEKVTEKTYEGLIESIGHLKQLRRLTIDGPLCGEKETFEAFSASLKMLEKLHDLFFCVQIYCEEEYEEEGESHERKIEESYCDDFVELLENMNALTDIMLIFEGLRFSRKSKSMIAKSLKNFRFST